MESLDYPIANPELGGEDPIPTTTTDFEVEPPETAASSESPSASASDQGSQVFPLCCSGSSPKPRDSLDL